jgi:hypothetical protein
MSTSTLVLCAGRTGPQAAEPTVSRPGWFQVAQSLHDLPVWAHYALATALVVLTLAVRNRLFGDQEGYQFVFFMRSS